MQIPSGRHEHRPIHAVMTAQHRDLLSDAKIHTDAEDRQHTAVVAMPERRGRLRLD